MRDLLYRDILLMLKAVPNVSVDTNDEYPKVSPFIANINKTLFPIL